MVQFRLNRRTRSNLGCTTLRLCEESIFFRHCEPLSPRKGVAIQDSTSSRLCEALRSNPGFLKTSSNYRVFPLSRPGAEHPGPPQDFLGRKSFAETERSGQNKFSNFREKFWSFITSMSLEQPP